METIGRRYGSVAEAYERWRLGYPDAVADAILAYAEPPVRTAVEIGAGTGKATRLIAARGIAVTAVEPDPEMVQVLRTTTVGLPVTPVISTYEALRHPPVDLLYAAAAFHWTADEGRWERAAALLRPGGTFATFAAPPALLDPDLRQAVSASVGRFTQTPTQTRRAPDADGRNWPTAELEASGLFDRIHEQRFPARHTLAAEHYVQHTATGSGYLALTADRLAAALADLRAVVPDRVDVSADVILHLARRC